MDNLDEAAHPDTASEKPPAPTGWSTLAAVAEALRSPHDDQRGQRPPASRGRSPKVSERIALRVAEDTEWLHDHQTDPRINVSRAARLWKVSALPEPAFYELLGEAKSKARAETKVQKRCSDHASQYNRMPLYFAALEQLVGLRDEHGHKVGEGRRAP